MSRANDLILDDCDIKEQKMIEISSQNGAKFGDCGRSAHSSKTDEVARKR
jgi:hypothetical protein